MAHSVVMPALEMAQNTGKLVAWIKKEGDTVRKGEPLLEIETDKAVLELEAEHDGVLAGVSAKAGDVVPVGQTIAWLVAPGESVPDAARPAADAAPRLSPKARRLAREQGLDVSTLKGSGPQGEVLAADVMAASTLIPLPSNVPSEPNAPGDPRAPTVTTAGRLMAERTTQSWTSVPHFFVAREVDATALNAARERALDRVQASHGVRVTVTDLIVAAVARALRQHPRMNASWENGGVQTHSHVHVALAMAVDNAVVTAVIPDTDRHGIGDLASRRTALAERARARRLQPADIAGATFTISNLGMFAVDAFTAIIVPPQAGILAVGAISERVVALDGLIGIRPMMTVTLSADHRVIDGAGAAAFLNDVVLGLQELGKWL